MTSFSDDIPRGLTSSSSSGLYIPVHRRSASSESSRTSPHGMTHSISCYSIYLTKRQGATHPVRSRVYDIDFLLFLRPTADESLRDKLRSTCPQILMSRRIRKNLEFHGRQRPHHDLVPTRDNQAQQQQINADIHRFPALPTQIQLRALPVTSSPQSSPSGRVLPRRNSKIAMRAAERRRWQPVQGTWRGLEGSPRPFLVV